MGHRRAVRTDVILYVASAAFAGGVALWADIPQFREWGRVAAIPYALGAAAMAALGRRGGGPRLRWALAGAVFLTAAVLPLALEVVWRAHSAPGLHAQSEVIVTEEAARALTSGRDPYDETYLHGPLEARPVPTKTHFPYFPAMLAFGLPRALDGNGPATDARWWFTLVAVGVAAAAIRRGRLRSEQALRTWQVLLILPSGALLMATSGDDLPVLALLLLSLVLLADRPGWSGLAAGAACALKQTAWILVPFLVVASPRARRTGGAAAAVVAPLAAAFLLWHPAAFVEDTIKFPLGLGTGASAAGTATPGSLLADVVPGGAAVVTAVLAVVVIGVGGWLLWKRPWPWAAGAAGAAAAVWAVVFLLAPVARIGYLVYPVNLLTWSAMLRPVAGPVEGSDVAIAGSVSS